MKPILVTGGAGYIGSHTCKALTAAGFLPVTYDSLVSGHRWAVKWGPLEEGELKNPARLDDVFRLYSPVAVLHFAAFAYVGESVIEPDKYYDNNVVGSLTLLQAMRRWNVNNIVFSSTCATYGIPDRIPIAETALQNPVNPYGSSKLMIERILRDFSAAYSMKSVALRYFNACGADPHGEIGENHDPEPHLVPRTLMAAAGNLPYLDIFGNRYPTADGSAVRDFIHVSDLAEAHVRALTYLLDGNGTSTFNLGTGIGTSVFEIISMTERITGFEVPIRVAPNRLGDPPVLVADPSLACRTLGFQPRYSTLETIISTAWDWYRQQHPKVAGVPKGIRAI